MYQSLFVGKVRSCLYVDMKKTYCSTDVFFILDPIFVNTVSL